MRDQIILNIQNPAKLESLYRSDKIRFKQEFVMIYPRYQNEAAAKFWYERLNYDKDMVSWGKKRELIFVVITCLIAGILAKLPELFSIDDEFFYPRNISFLIPFLSGYFIWKHKNSSISVSIIAGITIICLLYINFLPGDLNSDTLILACLHLPLLLWILMGVSFCEKDWNNNKKRLSFLSFNGDLLVMCALLMLAAIITTAITIGLFKIIGLNIEDWYFENVVIFCLPGIPILATHLTQANPNLVNKISPLIARIFSPIVLIVLVSYLVAVINSGINLYEDREFLIIFNVLLIGVMALIFFSVAESLKTKKIAFAPYVLFSLSIITIIINGIALSAIIFRISEGGITPNRLAVLGSNVLILVNLLIVGFNLFLSIREKLKIYKVGISIGKYLPIYFIWTAIVVFLFPIIFGFK